MTKFSPISLGVLTLVSSLMVGILAPGEPAYAQGDADVEAKFVAMLKNATLQGTWAPIQQGRLGSEKGDDS